VTGVTVHFVNEKVDDGPIAYQQAVPVLPGDDQSTLSARIQKVEHEVYPRVVSAFIAGRLQIAEGRVVWE
jgi:phosphoribosylglycinamide formyltransferase-1